MREAAGQDGMIEVTVRSDRAKTNHTHTDTGGGNMACQVCRVMVLDNDEWLMVMLVRQRYVLCELYLSTISSRRNKSKS